MSFPSLSLPPSVEIMSLTCPALSSGTAALLHDAPRAPFGHAVLHTRDREPSAQEIRDAKAALAAQSWRPRSMREWLT